MAFAGYAFNKSHAAAYAVVAYQTAWLKAHYPVEFMAAMLNSYLGSLGQAASYIRVCRQMGIKVLPPDINLSQARFSTENGSIRFALAAVKNVGEAAIDSLIAEREKNGPFQSFGDLLRRMDESTLNRKMVESLVRASALDNMGLPRSQMIAVIEPFTSHLAASRRLSMEGQLSFFELGALEPVTVAEPDYPQLAEFRRSDILNMEKEMLGLYVSGHPLDDYEEAIARLTSCDSQNLVEDQENELPAADKRIVMAGLLGGVKYKTTRKNDQMAFLAVEDLYGVYEVIVFAKVLDRLRPLLDEGRAYLISGRISSREDEAPKLIAEDMMLLEPQMNRLPSGWPQPEAACKSPGPEPRPLQAKNKHKLCLRYFGLEYDQAYKRLLATLQYFTGNVPVQIYFEQEDRLVELDPAYSVSLDDVILTQLAARYGKDNLALL